MFLQPWQEAIDLVENHLLPSKRYHLRLSFFWETAISVSLVDLGGTLLTTLPKTDQLISVLASISLEDGGSTMNCSPKTTSISIAKKQGVGC